MIRWTARRLELLRKSPELVEATLRTGMTKKDCDVARWALLGRSIDEGLAILNPTPSDADAARGQPWTAEQIAILRERSDLTDSKLLVLINAAGPTRSKGALTHKRKILGIRKLKKTKAEILSEAAMRGWPVMVGSDEERDRRFVRMVVMEGIRLGLHGKRRAGSAAA